MNYCYWHILQNTLNVDNLMITAFVISKRRDSFSRDFLLPLQYYVHRARISFIITVAYSSILPSSIGARFT